MRPETIRIYEDLLLMLAIWVSLTVTVAIYSWLRRIWRTLEPVTCQCGHERCYHYRGMQSCNFIEQPTGEQTTWLKCSCQIFIFDEVETEETAHQIEQAKLLWTKSNASE